MILDRIAKLDLCQGRYFSTSRHVRNIGRALLERSATLPNASLHRHISLRSFAIRARPPWMQRAASRP